MTIAEDFALAVISLRETVRLLENVAAVYPDAEQALVNTSMAEAIDPGTRAMLKCLLALGTFALAQKRAEETINALADASAPSSSKWIN